MLNLVNSTTDKLALITSSAATVDVHASWVDDLSDAMTPGRSLTAIVSATTTDIVATPAASTVRNVKFISIRNKDAALSCDVTVQYNNNGTIYQLLKCTLLIGEELVCREGIWFHYDVNGGVYGQAVASAVLNNFSTTAQTPSAATLTQITGSSIAVPASKLKIGTILRWTFDIKKTGAGTASSTYDVRLGTANSTADTAILTFTKPAGTAVIDTGKIVIEVLIRGPLGASCVAVGNFTMTHNLQITGHATIPCVNVNVVSSTFDSSVASLFASISCTTGASDAITTQQVIAETINLAP